MHDDVLYLAETREWAGLWWLPDDPDERVPGVLSYDPHDGLALSLIGAFEDRVVTSSAAGAIAYGEGTRTWAVVHGAAEQREITLLDAVPSSSERTFGARVASPDKQRVSATAAIIGAHVSNPEEPAFAVAEVSVEELRLWAGSSAYEEFIGVTDGKIDGTGHISAKPVASQSVLVDDTEYRLEHTYTLPRLEQRKGATIGRLKDETFMRVRPGEPLSLRRALREVRLVQDLISLATHRAAGVLWLRLELVHGEPKPSNRRAVPRRCANVLYSPTVLGNHDAKAVEHRRVFFTCASLPFEEVLPRWCEAHDTLQAAINMILGLRYAPADFVENNLLVAVGAAEVLHRNLCSDASPFPQEAFRTMREAMLAQVPEEHRDRFRGSIRNDPTLRDRLYALAGRPDQEAIAGLVPDVAYWAKRATRARNDLAHEGRTPSHSIEELAAIVQVTTAVVILNVLHEIGLPAERQREIVHEHHQLRATSRTAGKWLVPDDPAS